MIIGDTNVIEAVLFDMYMIQQHQLIYWCDTKNPRFLSSKKQDLEIVIKSSNCLPSNLALGRASRFPSRLPGRHARCARPPKVHHHFRSANKHHHQHNHHRLHNPTSQTHRHGPSSRQTPPPLPRRPILPPKPFRSAEGIGKSAKTLLDLRRTRTDSNCRLLVETSPICSSMDLLARARRRGLRRL